MHHACRHHAHQATPPACMQGGRSGAGGPLPRPRPCPLPRRTLSDSPHMCDTSKSDACCRQWVVESMMLSLYWIGMDQPAKGTILPGAEGAGQRQAGRKEVWLRVSCLIPPPPLHHHALHNGSSTTSSSLTNDPERAGPPDAARRTSMRDVKVVQHRLFEAGVVRKAPHHQQADRATTRILVAAGPPAGKAGGLRQQVGQLATHCDGGGVGVVAAAGRAAEAEKWKSGVQAQGFEGVVLVLLVRGVGWFGLPGGAGYTYPCTPCMLSATRGHRPSLPPPPANAPLAVRRCTGLCTVLQGER